jgi:hypothetical protein
MRSRAGRKRFSVTLGVPNRSGNATLSFAVLTVIALTFVLILSSVEGSTQSQNRGQKSPESQPNASLTARAAPVGGGCTSPARFTISALTAPSQGNPSFAFVGADTACTAMSPSIGPTSSSRVSFTLSFPSSTYLTLLVGSPAVSPAVAGSSPVPRGTSFTAIVGAKTFPVQVGSDPFLASPVIPVPSGETTFQIDVSVPNPYPKGTYLFVLLISTFNDSKLSFETYTSYIPVNLVAQ